MIKIIDLQMYHMKLAVIIYLCINNSLARFMS